jgi:hypothetical protein
MRANVDRWGEIHLTMNELSELTGSSRTTLWRYLVALQDVGIIETRRTKRNYGKLFKNVYKIIETSTASPSDNTVVDNQVTEIIKVKNTSYSLWGFAPEGEKMNRWSDDDDIGGFGLLEGEVPASQKPKPTSKRDTKTRNQRPQDQWTPNDVAAEFSSQLYSRIRGIPGLLNVNKLAPILGKYRKDYGTTALLELEVMAMMMGDDRRLADVKKDPANAWRIFLRMLATHGKKAKDNLEEPSAVDIVEEVEYIVASDGRKFDNSMPGRAAVERYEEKLRRA